MTTGRKPKPHQLRLVEGNRGRRPIPAEDKRVMPRVTDEIPEPPAFLHAYAVEEWHRVAQDLYQTGILAGVDRAALAGYCQAYGRWRLAEEKLAGMAAADPVTAGMLVKTTNGNALQNPLLSIANGALRDMIRFAAEFGMSPSARARIDSKRGDDEDEIGKKYFG